jgi:hypothetical protein
VVQTALATSYQLESAWKAAEAERDAARRDLHGQRASAAEAFGVLHRVCDMTAASARRCGDWYDGDGDDGGWPVERGEGGWSASQIPTPNRGAVEAALGRERGRGGGARGGQRERTDAEAVAQAAVRLERHLQRVEAAAVDARERAVAAERGMVRAEAAATAAAEQSERWRQSATASEAETERCRAQLSEIRTAHTASELRVEAVRAEVRVV